MPVLLLEGPRRWAQGLVQQRLSSVDEVIRLHPENLEAGVLRSELAARSLFVSTRGIVILDWQDCPSHAAKELQASLPLSAETTLILRKNVGGRKTKQDEIADELISVKQMTGSQLADNLLQQYGLGETSTHVKKEMMSFLPDQYDELCDVVEKCSATQKEALTLADLQQHGFLVQAGNVFGLMDALASGRIEAVLHEAELIAPKVAGDLQRLTGGLAWAVRNWIEKGKFANQPLRDIYGNLRALEILSKSSSISDRVIFLDFVRKSLNSLHGEKIAKKK